MYKLTLSAEDIRAIEFVGGRYNWSWILRGLPEGENNISEVSAWDIVNAFEQDTEGNHSPFPMLDPHSDLYRKLFAFWNEVV